MVEKGAQIVVGSHKRLAIEKPSGEGIVVLDPEHAPHQLQRFGEGNAEPLGSCASGLLLDQLAERLVGDRHFVGRGGSLHQLRGDSKRIDPEQARAQTSWRVKETCSEVLRRSPREELMGIEIVRHAFTQLCFRPGGLW